MGHQFDHRYELTSYSHQLSRTNPPLVAIPEVWVAERDVLERLGRRHYACTSALLGHRRVARNTDERTAIAAFIPFGAASYGWIVSAGPPAADLAFIAASYNSFVYDYCLRNSVTQASIPQSTSEQIPVLSPSITHSPVPWQPAAIITDWIKKYVLELTYTARDMTPFARDLSDHGPPFQWDPERRDLLRAELDAAFFLLYGVSREDADYILNTFPIVRRKDEERYGEYRTKRLILEIYDAMQKAMDTGVPYQTIVHPPPGEGPRYPEASGTVA